MARILLWNAAAICLAAIVFRTIDQSLQLGQFHGLVFTVWFLYALGAVALINLVLAGVARMRDRPILARQFLLGGTGLACAVGALFWVVASLIGDATAASLLSLSF